MRFYELTDAEQQIVKDRIIAGYTTLLKRLPGMTNKKGELKGKAICKRRG